MAEAQYEHIRAQILDTVYRSPPDGKGEAPMVTVDRPPPSEPMAVRITSSSRAYTYQLDRQLAKRKDLTEGPFDLDMGYRESSNAEGGGGRTSINSKFEKARRNWQQRSSKRASAANRINRTRKMEAKAEVSQGFFQPASADPNSPGIMDIEAARLQPQTSTRAVCAEYTAGTTDARTGSSPQWAHRIFDRFFPRFNKLSRVDDAGERDNQKSGPA
jgi:hypothetical protein